MKKLHLILIVLALLGFTSWSQAHTPESESTSEEVAPVESEPVSDPEGAPPEAPDPAAEAAPVVDSVGEKAEPKPEAVPGPSASDTPVETAPGSASKSDGDTAAPVPSSASPAVESETELRSSLTVKLHSGSRRTWSESGDRFGGERGTFGVQLTVDDLLVGSGLALVAGYDGSDSSSEHWESSLSLSQAELGLAWSTSFQGFGAHVRGSAVAAFMRPRIQDIRGATSTTFGATAGLGVDWRGGLSQETPINLVLGIDLGYTYLLPAALELAGTERNGNERVLIPAVPLGDLDMSGLFFRVSVGLHFAGIDAVL